MDKITFLGPYGATFSHDAYELLAQIYESPKVSENNYVSANKNGDILGIIAREGGFGTIAMETMAQARVTESVESFVDLLEQFKNIECPFQVIGAMRLKIHFVLMVRPGTEFDSITTVIGHQKAFGACRRNIEKMNVEIKEVSSNGFAAEQVAKEIQSTGLAALGPQSAADKYGLEVINNAFEDAEAITTFFLIGPKEFKMSQGKENRSILLFKTAHNPGSFVRAITSFAKEEINLIGIHSFPSPEGNRQYNFAVEAECSQDQLPAFARALEEFKKHVIQHLVFGPFEIVSV